MTRPVLLHVDTDVLAAPSSGIGITVEEVLSRLAASAAFGQFHVVRRGGAPGPERRRGLLRRVPGAYSLRQWRAGLPRVPRNAVFWAPNFILPPWPLAPARSVLTVQDLIFAQHPELADPVRGRFLRRSLPGSLARAAKIVVTTQTTADALVTRYGIARDKLCVIPLGIRQLRQPAAPARGGGPVLVFGNVEPRKDLLTLVRAHRALPAALRTAHPLLIAGSALDPLYAESLAAALDPPCSRWVGRLTDADLAAALDQASVVVSSSLAEGFGLTPLEAFVAGAPVVATDLAVTRELMGEHARYYRPGDPAVLKVVLQAALAAPRPPSVADRLRLAERYSWDRAAAAYAELFTALAQP